ncbi:hypothetical protein [uncultured Photobacterium sp.]|uniref:hypothetical protein n=1 Tax=uncultured Photobacterium sp. TaxID=173973 RepID=UPI00263A1544|nr:hypothetical protein [uncultured Photobacterium sp.]
MSVSIAEKLMSKSEQMIETNTNGLLLKAKLIAESGGQTLMVSAHKCGVLLAEYYCESVNDIDKAYKLACQNVIGEAQEVIASLNS